jgi:hypothetical protein
MYSFGAGGVLWNVAMRMTSASMNSISEALSLVSGIVYKRFWLFLRVRSIFVLLGKLTYEPTRLDAFPTVIRAEVI